MATKSVMVGWEEREARIREEGSLLRKREEKRREIGWRWGNGFQGENRGMDREKRRRRWDGGAARGRSSWREGGGVAEKGREAMAEKREGSAAAKIKEREAHAWEREEGSRHARPRGQGSECEKEVHAREREKYSLSYFFLNNFFGGCGHVNRFKNTLKIISKWRYRFSILINSFLNAFGSRTF